MTIRNITNSEAGTLAACEMEWWLYYRFNPKTGRGDGNGIAPKQPFIPFWAGTGFHIGMETLYTKGWDVDAAVKAALKNMELPEDAWLEKEMAEKASKTLASVEGALRGYARARAKDLDNWEVIWAEQGFKEIVIYNSEGIPVTTHTYAGKIDMLARRLTGKKAGTIWAWDHKFAGGLSKNDIEALRVADQPSRYLMALKQQGIEVQGMIWNMIKKPGIRQKKTETRDEYLDRLENDYVTRPEFYYLRDSVKFDEGRIKQSMSHLAASANRIHDLETEFRDPTRNTRNCAFMGRCRFMDICSAGKFTGHIARMFRPKEAIHEELVDGG